jgi:hypothetical protein
VTEVVSAEREERGLMVSPMKVRTASVLAIQYIISSWDMMNVGMPLSAGFESVSLAMTLPTTMAGIKTAMVTAALRMLR